MKYAHARTTLIRGSSKKLVRMVRVPFPNSANDEFVVLPAILYWSENNISKKG